MAVTKGHGNPDWTEDEVILALDLYFDLMGQIPSEDDKHIQELSALLRSFPYHAEAARRDSFRNPAGVAFKLQNLRQVATGKGLANTSKTDKAVWEAFGFKPAETKARADVIRAALNVAELEGTAIPDDELFTEGRAATYAHVRRERNRKARTKLIESRLKHGLLECDLCRLRADPRAEPYSQAVFEAHHLKPLSTSGETKTRITDLCLLCANCHRRIHRAIAHEKRWLTLDEARTLFRVSPPGRNAEAGRMADSVQNSP